MNKTLLFTLLLGIFSTAKAQTPCQNGMAGGYPCNNIDLISHLTIDEMGGADDLNDVWGWTDPEDGSEYVIVGKSNGTAFVNITDPLNPVYLGTLPTHTFSIIWRDMKVYNNYAFIVSEAGGHGMQVFDLTQLRDISNPPVEFEETTHYDLFDNCHNIVINEKTGYAYAVGTNTSQGGLHIIDISDPLNPELAGDFGEDGYTHDAQAVIYHGPDQDHNGKEIVFACNDDTFAIVDVEDKSDCELLFSGSYVGNGYAHQGWLTENHRYFLMNDETDETNFGHNTKTYVWDVQDLDNPVMVGFHYGPTPASDHNMYMHLGYLYQSNYLAGLRILELVDLPSADLEEIAYFDVAPSTNSNGFHGSWSNYPYFESGVIAVTSIEQGLFIVKPVEGLITSIEEENDYKSNVDVELFPNPAEDYLKIHFSGNSFQKLNVEVIDLSGRRVALHRDLPLVAKGFALNLSGITPGVYAVRFPGTGLKAQRFIIR